MKKLLLLLTLFGSFVLRAQDSIPDYFAASPQWVVDYSRETQVQLFLSGDTVVNGTKYHKLMAASDDLTGFDSRIGDRLQGLIRQEGRRVYYRGFLLFDARYNNVFEYPITEETPLPRKEFLLFDFGLELGDTLFVQDNPLFERYIERFPEDTAFVVNQVDSNFFKIYPNSFVNAIQLKNSSSFYTLTYYEGVSESSSFISDMFPYIPESFYCYKNDSSEFIEDRHVFFDDNNCSFVTSTENISLVAIPTVYPQPSNGVLNFSEGVNSYSLYNIHGQRVLSNTEISQQIDIKHLPNGLYFLHYTFGHQKSALQRVVLSK
tara:strand:- start:4683 stop:5639 length:957 start_codon:yes stop_codon:yes gene_type:complete